ncbi:MAG: hypothetical protein JWM10_3616 [Myxococcaceae bacterium]|nr:hypothetical protein [Myxococcaceae bacterium]
MTPETLLALLTLAFPSSAHRVRPEVAPLLTRAADVAAIPAPLLAAVCWTESRLGTAPRYASLCGIRVRHAFVRDDARSAELAAGLLARRFAECGTWRRALVAFRAGDGCRAADPSGYADRVLGVARRLGLP